MNNNHGGQYNSCGDFPILNSVQKYPLYSINYNYQMNKEMINVSKAFETYNWFVNKYYDVINIYNDLCDKYDEIKINSQIRGIDMFDNYEPMIKLQDYKIFHFVIYPYQNIIPHNEMVILLNKMNDIIINIKNFIFNICEIIKYYHHKRQ